MNDDLILVIPPVAYIGYPTLECATLAALISANGIQGKVVELNLALLQYFIKVNGKKVKLALKERYGANPNFELIYWDKIAEIFDFEKNHQYLDSLALKEDFKRIIDKELNYKSVKYVFVILEYMRVSNRAINSLLNLFQLLKRKFGEEGTVILTGYQTSLSLLECP